MATYKYKTSDISKKLTAAESTLYNCVKRFNLYLSPRSKEFLGADLAKEFKGWAKERGVDYKKITIAEVLYGWGKYADGATWADMKDGKVEKPVTICKVPRYKLTEDGLDFVYQETEDKRGHKQYSKVVEFYTFEKKAAWTLAEVATCVGRAYGEGRNEVAYKLETAYELIDNKLIESDDAAMIERAKITAADEAALIAAANAE